MDIENFKFSKDLKTVSGYETLAKIVGGYRAQGKTIALTMGSFDMFHDGHSKYIEIAASIADILILGVDDDALIKRDKGENRPFDNIDTRTTTLAALGAVDHVFIKGVDDPIEKLCETVRPDVLVISQSSGKTKSYDSNKKDLKETFEEMMERMYVKTKIAGEMVVLPPQSSQSTTEKLRRLKTEIGSEFGAQILNKLNDVTNFVTDLLTNEKD